MGLEKYLKSVVHYLKVLPTGKRSSVLLNETETDAKRKTTTFTRLSESRPAGLTPDTYRSGHAVPLLDSVVRVKSVVRTTTTVDLRTVSSSSNTPLRSVVTDRLVQLTKDTDVILLVVFSVTLYQQYSQNIPLRLDINRETLCHH